VLVTIVLAFFTLVLGDYTTMAGLVLDRLGRLAEVGDAVTVDDWRIEVLAVDQRAIARVVLTRRT
jgi:CBS domain containing-hemolysin-like protein